MPTRILPLLLPLVLVLLSSLLQLSNAFNHSSTTATTTLPGNTTWLGDYSQGDGTPDYHDYLPLSYVVMGPGSDAVCRVIVGHRDDCPELILLDDPAPSRRTDTTTIDIPPVKLRGVGDYTMPYSFPIKVCDARLTTVEQKAAWSSGKLTFQGIGNNNGDDKNVVIPTDPKRYAHIGDTGLRVKPKNLGLQQCRQQQQQQGSSSGSSMLYGIQQCAGGGAVDFTQADLDQAEVRGSFQGLDEWKLKTLVDRIAAQEEQSSPDIVVHVGDYMYRQGPCPAGSGKDCVGINDPQPIALSELNGTTVDFMPGNWGDNWFGWWADVLFPSLSLLKTAPWIVVRGNHESCDRGGHGFFLLMDPREYPEDTRGGNHCVDGNTPVYNVAFDNEQFLVVDNNRMGEFYTTQPDDNRHDSCPAPSADGSPIIPASQNRYKDPQADKEAIEEELAMFTGYWEQVETMSASHENNFVLVHRPVFSVSCSYLSANVMTTSDWNMQHTLKPETLKRISGIISGHLHIAQGIQFVDNELPVQVVVGHGGTELHASDMHSDVWSQVKIKVETRDGGFVQGTVDRGFVNVDMHGFAVMERNTDNGDYGVVFKSLDESIGELVDIEFPITVPKGPPPRVEASRFVSKNTATTTTKRHLRRGSRSSS